VEAPEERGEEEGAKMPTDSAPKKVANRPSIRPRIVRADYVWCDDCAVVVPKKMLRPGPEPLFSDEESPSSCPFCAGEKLEPLTLDIHATDGKDAGAHESNDGEDKPEAEAADKVDDLIKFV
jgi:hypothetical protein